ncbi:surface lipoprotein assembly modifier [uncultured Tateyamaria sp.]|uniref:surface lipoprotein assembly modifier n=1 Tax=uncultured Tateyamaria sp. TaxID=455651 RepID=UPI00262B63BE|nr:surface lipoprotein assembly modifier [uncultured Tateyamaria sp.]
MKRALLAALLALLASAGASDPGKEDSQTFTVEQARVLARQALYAGRFDLARDVATVLVRANPEDAYAYGILAAAQSRLKAHKQARSAARLSYKHSETPAQKFGAARTAASIAFQQERPTASQIWLRLAATHAETPRQDEVLSRDYSNVRRANPLRFNINLSVAPSNNVNNGTDNVLEVNNGIPTGSGINASSRALDGTVGTLDVQLRYRLAQSQKSRTTASGRLYVRRVKLSAESERELQEDAASHLDTPLTNSNFDETYADVGLEHTFALGAPGNTLSLGTTVGAKWFVDDRLYDSAKLTLSRGLKLSDATRLQLHGGFERRFYTAGSFKDRDIVTLGGTVSHKLKGGDKLSVGLTVQEQNGDFTNSDYMTASIRANYSFGKQLGPVRISTGLTFGYTDYDDYRLFRSIDGGRQDESLYGDVSLFFADYDFAGFAPNLRIRTGRRSSNVNRFEIDETTITLGIQSKF